MSGKRRFRLLPTSTRAWLATAAVALLVIVGIVLAGYLYEKHRTGDIYHPQAPFVPQPTPTLPKVKGQDHFAWPLYGYTKNHTRFFPASPTMRPPFRTVWARGGSALLEFPPVMSGNRIFQLGDDATLNTIDKYTGQILWSRRLGALSASTPAVAGDTVYATVLSRSPGSQAGRVVALNTLNGHFRWTRDLPSRAESSPLLDQGKLFFGSQNGTVYALNASNGNVLWTYHAAGAVKASPSLSGGVLYFGDYSGELQAVGEQHGHLLWRSGSGGALLGSGTFYSTPAVMYGRVFLGNTDGRVYAYDASSGALDWAVQTGAYVYASPAVTNAPGLGPTIYLGSYDGTFYALNARSGHIEWQYHAGGKISGSATIIGNIVYFADLGTHRTIGLGISTGKVVFSMNTGSFDPVISDNHYLYLSGITGLYALAPLDATPQRTRTPNTTGPGTSKPRAKAAAAAIAKAHANVATKGAKTKRVVVIHRSRPVQAHAPAKSAPAHARHRGT
ncbi:MAG TPA: PQQ-binding-like beta-propeller repeat protein [Solirubrobacteraceae bacterium]|jgi:outer membrane protein assembly factor BamB|nr:PQQ-binding-like beta-propeller repeat protein [Solirubrobacteraceae bacterium]